MAQIFYKTWIYDFDFQTLGFARVAWLFSNWSWWLFSNMLERLKDKIARFWIKAGT